VTTQSFAINSSSHVIFSIQALDHAPRGCCLISTSHSLGILVLQRTGCHWQAFSYHRCASHIRIQVFSSHVADCLLLTSNMRSCCRCTRYWQTSLIKITTFFAFSRIHGYRLSRAISSPCHRYRYPPRSTEHISLVLHPVILQISSRIAVTLLSPRRCPVSSPFASPLYPRVYQVLHSRPSRRFRQLSRTHTAVISILSLSSHPLASSISSCRCLSSSSSSSSTSTSRTTASQPRRSSPLERAYCHELCVLPQARRRLYPIDF
jgi:hypothetical protein